MCHGVKAHTETHSASWFKRVENCRQYARESLLQVTNPNPLRLRVLRVVGGAHEAHALVARAGRHAVPLAVGARPAKGQHVGVQLGVGEGLPPFAYGQGRERQVTVASGL